MARILVVNNDIELMSLLQRWLEKKNYNVKYTGDPEEVFNSLDTFKPDLMIIDILRKDVIQALNKNHSPIPILLMNSYARLEKTNDIEVDDIIEKPFNLEILDKKVKKLCPVQD
jgi:DNA-binding response OmpR family regulator